MAEDKRMIDRRSLVTLIAGAGATARDHRGDAHLSLTPATCQTQPVVVCE
jgi:hypothetical protein